MNREGDAGPSPGLLLGAARGPPESAPLRLQLGPVKTTAGNRDLPLLGLADEALMTRHYTHVDADAKRDALSRLNKLLSGDDC